jgi:hypothetical protein
MRVAGLRDQLLEDLVALDLGDAQQLRTEPTVQFVQRGGQVLFLRLVRRRCPPLGRGEVEVARDRIVDRVANEGGSGRPRPAPPLLHPLAGRSRRVKEEVPARTGAGSVSATTEPPHCP